MSKRFANKPKLDTDKITSGKVISIDSNPNGVRDLGDSWQLPPNINNGVAIPKKFFDEEGNLDLRRATGPEALAYLRKVGINLSIPLPIS